jgi:membrane associated rhomboid family serine protease
MNEFRPIGTYGLLGVYIHVFIAFNLISYDYESALRAGAQESVLVATGEWWRLISSMFMHFGLLHIAFNGFFLTRIGPLLEFELGTERFLAVFLVSGLGGSAAAGIVYGPVQLCGGASGGLFGMMGALLAVYSREERSYGMALRDPRVKGILSLVLVNVVIGALIPMISQTAHLGGLFSGFLLTWTIFRLQDAKGRPQRPPLLPALAFILLFGSVVWTAIEPVHRDWYRTRSWYFAPPESDAALRASLLRSGISENALDFLDAIRQLRDRPAVPIDDPALLEFVQFANDGRYQDVGDVGVNPAIFNPLLGVFREPGQSSFDTRGQVPYDPWLKTMQ